jgi:glycosyltransferase involved in cell wall biosynthesis
MLFGKIQAPLVSIIVVNYNYGRFLDESLMSIAHQTYPHLECIVFDNGSTDNSRSILAAAKEKYSAEDGRSLSVILSETNLHQTPAAAQAFASAKGSYIIFFDADDYMLPACVETHIHVMLSLRCPVGATCVDYFMSRDGELVTSTANLGFAQAAAGESQCTPLAIRLTDLPATSKTGATPNLLASELRYVARTTRDWPWSGTCGLCFRREMIEILFRRTPQLKQQLDAYLIGGVNCLTGSVLIDRPLVVYRQHGANVFAQHPHLANFRLYDPRTQRVAAATTAAEIIKTFVYTAEELARRLERSDLFIEAIETLSAIWSPRPRKSVTVTYMRAFLKANAATLVAAFGQKQYAEWIARYSWRYFAASFVAEATRSFAQARANLRPNGAKRRPDRKLGPA